MLTIKEREAIDSATKDIIIGTENANNKDIRNKYILARLKGLVQDIKISLKNKKV